jgi:predicted ATPase/DNA-binding winged helix-turn-helix (wHTH) protein
VEQVSYRCGDFTVDTANRRFSRGGADVVLEPRVLSVVLQLLSRPGELLTREELLDAVWGHRYVTPSTLNRVIALARRAFGDDVDSPTFIQTVHGAGYRYIGPIEAERVTAADRRARFEPPPSARLPARLESLIGREGELDQMEALLAESRSLTVLGTGGMGKTQCALEFARRKASDYPDGVWFFDLVPMQHADEWLQSLALALSIPPIGARDTIDKVCRALAGRRALVLIDNCDRISTGVGTLVLEMLRATDELKVLATSQQQLNFLGERVFRMPPLGLPAVRRPSGEADLNEVAAAPAVALLLTRIAAVQLGFALTAANAPSIVEICERLDGMPLALELAAARFALLSPEQVLERLDQRFRFLSSDAAGRDSRHRNLIALLDWSFGLLSPEEQQLLTWLGVFVQGWTVEAAIDVAAALGRDPTMVVELLTGLVNKSLVTVDQSVSPPRYALLESVREFALAQLAASGDERRARDAHLAFVRRMTEAAHRDMLDGRMRERIVLLVLEHGNIESALDHALGAGDDRVAALAIAGSLLLYFKAHGTYTEGLRVCQRALSGTEALGTPERGRALLCFGVASMSKVMQGLTPDRALLDAARIARLTGDRWAEAYASGYYALWLVNFGRADEADDSVVVAERIAEQLNDQTLRGLAGLARGWLYLARDKTTDAIGVLRAVRNFGHDFHQRHFIDTYIGLALFRLGDYGAAANQLYEGMRRSIEVGNIRGVAGSIEGCGYLAERLGKAGQAARLLGAAARIRERTEIPLFNFWIVHHEFADQALRSALGSVAYEAAMNEGTKMREEDVMNEAAHQLREFGELAGRSYAPASSPVGS